MGRLHPYHSYPSSYVAGVAWAVAGFMAQPTVASLFVHLIVLPVALFISLWLAHWEGRREI